MSDSTTYVGLDVHKKEHRVVMYLPGDAEPQEWSVANTASAIRRLVRRVRRLSPGPVAMAYEAGVCGFALQRQIEAAGARCLVAAPSLIPLAPGERVRTDRRDARKLGRLLRAGMLTAVHPPSASEEAVRDLCRLREAALTDLGRIRHQVLKLLLRRGWRFAEGRHWTQKHLAWLRRVDLGDPLSREVLTELLAELSHRQERLAHLERRVVAVAAEPAYREQVGWLRCFKGIDTVSAITVLAELFAFARFDSPRKLMSYLGLTPGEDSSGETTRRGPITKAGNRRVRRVLIESAWHQRHRPMTSKALRARRAGQPAWVVAIAEKAERRLHHRYWRLVNQGKPPVKAATAVARETAGFLWAVLRNPPATGASP